MNKVREYYNALDSKRERFAFLWFWAIVSFGVAVFLAALANTGGFFFMFGVMVLIAIIGLTGYSIKVLANHDEKKHEPDHPEDV